jgi:chaperonin GroES
MNLKNNEIESIRPLHDRILIKRVEEDHQKTAGGIYIPEVAKEKPQIGVIVATGAGKISTSGAVQPMTVKVGDRVFFGKFAGTEINAEYLLIREDEVLAILDSKK